MHPTVQAGLWGQGFIQGQRAAQTCLECATSSGGLAGGGLACIGSAGTGACRSQAAAIACPVQGPKRLRGRAVARGSEEMEVIDIKITTDAPCYMTDTPRTRGKILGTIHNHPPWPKPTSLPLANKSVPTHRKSVGMLGPFSRWAAWLEARSRTGCNLFCSPSELTDQAPIRPQKD